MEKNLENKIHSRAKHAMRNKIIAVVVTAAVIVLVLGLMLMHKPEGSSPPASVTDGQLSPYLTNVLSPEIYNGIQRQKPFSVTITQQGVNDIILHGKWPAMVNGVSFFAPRVYITEKGIVAMGMVGEAAYTVVAVPCMKKGMMSIPIKTVKIGAINVTPIVKSFIRKGYERYKKEHSVDSGDIRQTIMSSLIDGKAFEPVFDIQGKRVRISKISSNSKEFTLYFEPESPKIAVKKGFF